jgi:hypothetical protein
VFSTPAPLANGGSLQGLLGAAHPPRGTIFVVTLALLVVANFGERRNPDVARNVVAGRPKRTPRR